MPTPPVAVADFKVQFPREFTYGIQLSEVLDADITRALNEATLVFNADLWEDSTAENIAFLYAAAHFMVLNLQVAGGLTASNTSQGVKSKGGGTIISKSVGGVSVQYVLPPSITEDKILSGFMHTDFGQRYLQLLTPRLVGGGFVVESFTDQDIVIPPTVPPGLISTGNFDIDTAADISFYGSVQVHYFFNVMSVTEVSARLLLPRNVNIKGFIVQAATNTLNGATVLTFLKNGVAQALTVTLAAGATEGRDGVGLFSAVAGDNIDIKVALAATTGVLTSLRATVTFV